MFAFLTPNILLFYTNLIIQKNSFFYTDIFGFLRQSLKFRKRFFRKQKVMYKKNKKNGVKN